MPTAFFVFLLSLSLLTAGCAASDERAAGGEPQPAVAATPDPEPAPQPVGARGKKPAGARENKSGSSAKGRKSEDQIRNELNDVARRLTGQAARTVRPSKSSKEVKRAKEEHVASYVEVDTVDVTTELRPAAAPGQYVGIIRYTERLYECRGANQKAALAAPCREVGKSGRTEMIMFDGKAWRY
ncbi:MAG: translation initiation factor 2 [Desulfovibrio sp.]|nr:translation initiation factor 2 [Desulfovibrio sp.]